MATIQLNTPDSESQVMTTDLNSLADGGNVLSAAQSNDGAGELDLLVDVELDLAAQGSARDSGAYVALYLLTSSDGTNYDYGDGSTDPALTNWVGNFPLDAATNARRVSIRGIPLPPSNYKWLLQNNTGQAFASSGTILTEKRYNLSSA